MQIQTLEDLKQIWPDGMFYLAPGGSQYNGPCPFCPASEGDTHYKTINGELRSFVGTDRFFIRVSNNSGTCRFCALRGEGRNGNGWYSLKDISARLGFIAPEQMEHVNYEEVEDQPLTMLWYDSQVVAAHQRVDYEYWWETCGWSEEIVNEFHLGLGTLYQRMGEANIIPMQVQKAYEDPIDGWYIAARNSKSKERSPGSSKHYFWFVEYDRASKTVVLTESEKNNITHVTLGYENTVAVFGAGNKNRKLLEYLWSLGYRHVILAGDNDEAGREFNNRFGNWARQLKFDYVAYIDWPTDFKKGGDTTDLLRDNGGDINATLLQFEGWLTDFTVPHYDETIEQSAEIVELDDLRGTGPNSIYGWETNFLETYAAKRSYGRGRLLLLAVPPGAGKTHTSVRVAEEIAREHLTERAEARLVVEQSLVTLEDELAFESNPIAREELQKAIAKTKMKLEDWSVTAVGWFGQYINQWADLQRIGIDPDLWYDYQARSEANCGNYETVKELGENHHNIGAFCKNGCPLRELCLKNGYLKQEEERKEKPIVFFRHGNLPQQEMVASCKKLVLIDENPTSLFEQSLKIRPEDLNPFFPERETYYAEDQNYQSVKELCTAIRAAMSINAGAVKEDPNYLISGAAFYRQVDMQLRLAGTTLPQLLDEIPGEALDLYQPNYISGGTDHGTWIGLRCVPDLIKTMQRELPDYILNEHHESPSCVHLLSGKLLVFPVERLTIPTNIPVIVADGTALPQLYEAMFNRDLEVFRPEIRNANCQTIVIGGSDWLKSIFNRQVGHIVQKRKRMEKQLIAASAPDKPINLDDLPIDEAFDSKFIEEAVILIKGLAEQHEKLLVISYKDLRGLLEGHIEKIHPHLKGRISWGHYGAMRGTNFYEDYPAVLLIGAFRIPYDAAYLYVSMWATLLGIKEKIDPDTIVKVMRYDGQDEGYEYRTFAHPFGDAYVNAREQAEMRQSVERIRPHATKAKKFIYSAAARPFLRAVNQIIKKKDFLDRYRVTKKSSLYEFLMQAGRDSIRLLGRVQLPTFRVVEQEFNMSRTDITKIRKQVLLELEQNQQDV